MLLCNGSPNFSGLSFCGVDKGIYFLILIDVSSHRAKTHTTQKTSLVLVFLFLGVDKPFCFCRLTLSHSGILMPVNFIVLNNSQHRSDTCGDASRIFHTCQQRQRIEILLLGGLIHFWQEAEKIALKAASCMFHIVPQNQRNDPGVLSTNRASEPRRDASKKFPLARGLGGSYTYWTFSSRSFCTGLTRSWITVSGKSWL